MYTRMLSFLNKPNILCNQEYGFLKSRTTTLALIHFLNHIANANNKANLELTMGIFDDLRSAFDRLNHEILLQKI